MTTFTYDHIHLRSTDPEKTAAWYGKAFGFKIAEQIVRPAGDLFITCATPDGTL